MSRFSAWARGRTSTSQAGTGNTKLKALKDEGEEVYFVDNSELQSSSLGILYRKSPNLSDKVPGKIAEFNTVVRGQVVDGSFWLRVGELFLPTKMGGKTVLLQAWWPRAETDDDIDLKSPLNPAAERVSLHGNATGHGCMQLQEQERRERRQGVNDVQLSHTDSPPETRPLTPGSGCPYEVVCERLLIRTAPSLQGPLQGTRRKGQSLELFDWDPSRCWRRVLTRLGSGWVLLDHAETGPIVRPLGVPYSKAPLNPLCQAAREGCVPDVQRFISEGLDTNAQEVDGRTPLMLSMMQQGWKGLVACLLLLEAKADLSVLSGVDRAQAQDNLERLESQKAMAVKSEDFVEAAKIKCEIDTIRMALSQTSAGVSAHLIAGNTAAGTLLQMLELGTCDGNYEAASLLRAFDEIPENQFPDARNVPRRVECLLKEAEMGRQKATRDASLPQFVQHVSSSRAESLLQKAELNRWEPPESTQENSKETILQRPELNRQEIFDCIRERATGASLDPYPKTESKVIDSDDDELPQFNTRIGEDKSHRRGISYRVMQDKAYVYQDSSMQCELLGTLRKNQTVEVIDYDRSRMWGRVEVVHPKTGFTEKGWVPLEDDVLGNLLKACRR